MTTERQKPVPFEVVVEDVVVEAPDAVTLLLATSSIRPEYKAGQFLTIDPHQFPALRSQLAYLQHLKSRKELPRAYSMSSAPHEQYLAITIKEEPYTPGVSLHPPLLSPPLTYAMPKGTRMNVVGFTGPYILPPDIEERTDHILHVVAGSGAVPNFSILKDSLVRHPRLRHTFINSNRTWNDILFRDALLELETKHPHRLRLVNTLTRQTDFTGTRGHVRTGRVSEALFAEHLTDAKTAFAYVCGPAITSWERRAALESKTAPTPRFLETTLATLERLGMQKAQIKREAYG